MKCLRVNRWKDFEEGLDVLNLSVLKENLKFKDGGKKMKVWKVKEKG